MPLTVGELERLRLILSTFQDGSGWEKQGTRFGFRQFERAFASVVGGQADENKALFDVVAERTTSMGAIDRIGFSCKLRGKLRNATKHIYIEVSNAVSQFDKHLQSLGLPNKDAYREDPTQAGKGVLQWIGSLHMRDAEARGIHLPESVYSVMLYDDKAGTFELFEIPIDILLSDVVDWSATGNHLVAKIGSTVAIEYYWKAGQLKFYVPPSRVVWRSGVFTLEALPFGAKTLIVRAEEMFPVAWAKASSMP